MPLFYRKFRGLTVKTGRNIMIKVSVIVPCLNMKNYIKDCLDSIVNQTLRELEILVVDGGSSDGTLDILEGYGKTEGHLRVIRSEKKSYGYQVNLGLELATGEYIAIVDADDRIASNMYAALYEKAVRSQADYVKGAARSFWTLSESAICHQVLMQFGEDEYMDGEIELAPAERPDLLTRDNFLWYGIFRREFMKQIRLHESPGAAFQDLGGLLQTQMKAQKAVYLKEVFYEYRQDNAQSSEHNPKGFRFVWEEYTWAERFIGNASDGWKAAFYRKFFLHTMSRYYAMTAFGERWESAQAYIYMIRDKLADKLKEGIIGKNHFSEEEWTNLHLLISDENRLYEKYLDMHMPHRKQLLNIPFTAGGRDIVIFGYGLYGTYVHAQVLKQGWGKVTAYCDNQVGKQGLSFWGVPVLKPCEAVRRYPDNCFVVANSKHFGEMEKQLVSMGIETSRICCYTAGVDNRLLGITLA